MRYAIIGLVFLIGLKAEGISGGFMAVVIFGIMLVCFYTACDAWESVKGAVGPRQQTEITEQHLHVHTGETMPGQPTSQEWAGIVEVGRQNYNRQRGY